ncbi:sensor histidine kinase [Streptomyces flavofungini]|uniref:histidine kinase n=1 Tax=Streptomyces flavofungini TaxID=68200 RepID=A0ABS0XD90_9ACTN|nr:sensor histidine kinase [Streptomyces flavofungini]MBJ3811175.1 hypothetical protein [Streptomyces flavofungini]GHC67570.1 hypothetical protein GCM10010349_40610 [Streptomyces flavofungini]
MCRPARSRAVVVQGAAALRLADDRPELAADALAAGAASGRNVLASLGRLVAVVGDESAGGAPHESLPHLCAGLARLGFPVTRTAEGRPRPVPGVTSVVAYRIVQESLTNAMRYAAGAPVAVHLRDGARELAITVSNGPPPGGTWVGRDAPLGSGRGLAGMRERAASVGGGLSARPTGDGGWTVEATLPIPGAHPRTRAPSRTRRPSLCAPCCRCSSRRPHRTHSCPTSHPHNAPPWPPCWRSTRPRCSCVGAPPPRRSRRC